MTNTRTVVVLNTHVDIFNQTRGIPVRTRVNYAFSDVRFAFSSRLSMPASPSSSTFSTNLNLWDGDPESSPTATSFTLTDSQSGISLGQDTPPLRIKAKSNAPFSLIPFIHREVQRPSLLRTVKVDTLGLPLITDLRQTVITVSESFNQLNEQGKKDLCINLKVDPRNGRKPWQLKKVYGILKGLDVKTRSLVGKRQAAIIPAIPPEKAWRKPEKDKVNKARLSMCLTCLLNLAPVEMHIELHTFLTSDVVGGSRALSDDPANKEGYLLKRVNDSRNWIPGYFILSNPDIYHYDRPGGILLGTIHLTHSQLGWHGEHSKRNPKDRHDLLVVEERHGERLKHIFRAESIVERDEWINALGSTYQWWKRAS
ncbi:hypothetical protein FISHEDRAFT_76172 [Fistulina hepatica ATCC 64428]|uniref:PH domain-containing protein n=1 Tax=Fistulina hepatica ATCC 64428 TaxID=1128425 RepID=A0A0D7A547_9AGAR|nr:hypothetical protein FISHEDRAFT_76172 [Fistulina hepatica ATCC 64428]